MTVIEDQKLKNTQVFMFDIENTLFDVIGPGIKAQAAYLPLVAKKLGIDTRTFGLEIGRAMDLEKEVIAANIPQLTPSVIKAAGAAGYLDAAEALPKLDAIYAAFDRHDNGVKQLITDFNAQYADAINGEHGFLVKENAAYNKISHTGLDLYPHIKDYLRELRSRGFPVIFVSSKHIEGLLPNVKKFGLDKEADLIISAPHKDDMTTLGADTWTYEPEVVHAGLDTKHMTFPQAGMLKKSPVGFKELAKTLGINLEHAAMTGDNPVEDIKAIQKQGGIGILAGWGDTRPQMEPLKDYHWYYKSALEEGKDVKPDMTFIDPADIIKRVRKLDLKADPAIKAGIMKRVADLDLSQQPQAVNVKTARKAVPKSKM